MTAGIIGRGHKGAKRANMRGMASSISNLSAEVDPCFVDESMEYWPYDGEVWPDEIQ